jgi:GAF domain-containing protein
MALLSALVQLTQAASSLEETLAPIARAVSETFGAEGCILQLTDGNTLVATQGAYSDTGTIENWLSQDPLTTEAIATGQMRLSLNILKDTKLVDAIHYQNTGVQAHLVIPISYRNKLLGVLSLHWKQPCTLREDELILINLSAQLVAIALTSSANHQTIL